MFLFDETINALLKHAGIEVNRGNDKNHTGLYFASARGHVNVVKEFLAHSNIDVNKTSKSGKSPLHIACEHGKHKVLELLLKRPEIIGIKTLN